MFRDFPAGSATMCLAAHHVLLRLACCGPHSALTGLFRPIYILSASVHVKNEGSDPGCSDAKWSEGDLGVDDALLWCLIRLHPRLTAATCQTEGLDARVPAAWETSDPAAC